MIRVTAPQGSDLYEEQMEQMMSQQGQPGPMAMANIAAPMPQHQQAPAPIIQPQPGVMGQAKDMVVDKAVDMGIEKVAGTALGKGAGAALGKMGAAFGPMGMIAGEVAGQLLPQLIKGFFNDGGHVGPLGAKYYSVGTPPLFGDAYADPDKMASSSVSPAYQGAPMSNAVAELNKVDRPKVGSDIQSSGGFGGLLSGLFNSPVFAPLSNLVSGVSEWAGEAFPDAGSSAAAKAIAAEDNKGKNWLGSDKWTHSIGNRTFTTRTPERAHRDGLSTDWQYMNTLKNTGGSPYKGFKGALNAAIPGAVGATPIYNKKTDTTNWFHNPTPQQLHPHLKDKGHAYSDGGKVQYYSPGSAPYRGVFNKPTNQITEIVKATRPNPTTGIQNIINNAPRARAVTPNALSIAPRFMGPLGTVAAVLNPTQAAVATRNPVDAAPMGLEAEMFRQQAAIDAAKPSIWERYKGGDIPYTVPSMYKTGTDAIQNAFEAGIDAAKGGLENVGRWAMPKVIDKAGGLVDLLAPLAPPSRSPNPRQGYESGQDKGPTPNWSETFPPIARHYMAPPTSGMSPPSRSPNPRQGYESGQDKGPTPNWSEMFPPRTGLMDMLAPLAPPLRSPNPRQGYESGEDRGQMYSSPRVYAT